eukprot:TRINITY_DN12280_c0_g1_i1.p1 TRINITY_DN12280_c0_g1~~TRINITY_DN12280_c0_g1_i1.p1  ORF type:complete len:383 (+),score=123.93 TRINITY_DN12280_c0_g1_i1:105-1151(+)
MSSGTHLTVSPPTEADRQDAASLSLSESAPPSPSSTTTPHAATAGGGGGRGAPAVPEETREGQVEEEGGGDWWSWGASVVANVKQKTSEIYAVVQEDLQEFGETVATDTKDAVNQFDLTESVSSSLTKGVAALSQVAGGFVDTPTTPSHLRFDLTCDPLDESYPEWQLSFSLDSHDEAISQLLAEDADVRSSYALLVPAKLNPSLFWSRFFFLLEREEAEKALKRSLQLRADNSESVDEIGWDDDFDVEEHLDSASPSSPVTASPVASVPVDSDSDSSPSPSPSLSPSPSPPSPSMSLPPKDETVAKAVVTEEETEAEAPAEVVVVNSSAADLPQGEEEEDDDWLNWG